VGTGWYVDSVSIQDAFCCTNFVMNPPTASFIAAPSSGCAPLQVFFTDTSGNTPTSWAWDFGDPPASTSQNPTHTYTTPGTYTVQLIASNAYGSSTNTQVVSVNPPIQCFESKYGVPADASDSDGDGLSNTNEWLAGFNPTNNAAYLHIISIVRTDGTNVTVTYLGASGDSSYQGGPASRTNILESTLGTPPDFVNTFAPTGLTNILSGGTGLGTQATFVDTNGVTNPAKYYRVRVLLP
jgi:PKD repeat protein